MEWIDVKQGLPVRSDSRMKPLEHSVLMVINGKHVHMSTCYAYADSHEWRLPHVFGDFNHEVTHWMLTPASPTQD